MTSRFDEIVGYTFQADTFCPACIVDVLTNGTTMEGSARVGRGLGETTEERLDRIAQYDRIDRLDEYSFDSDTFPKVILAISVHSGDGPDYCGRCHELLAPYECAICGNEHGEDVHGEPLVQRDLGRDTVPGLVGTFLEDALVLMDGVPATGDITFAGRVYRLMNEWASCTDDERDEHASEYLDDIDAVLSDAGYLPVTDADQGTWAVYRPAPDRGEDHDQAEGTVDHSSTITTRPTLDATC